MKPTRVQAIFAIKWLFYACCLIVSAIPGIVFISSLQETAQLPGPWFDDAYMYVRYAQNILDGYGYCWNNDQPPVYGCTDILFTYLLVGCKWLLPFLDLTQICLWIPIVNFGLLMVIFPLMVGNVFSFSPKFLLPVTAIASFTFMSGENIIYHLFTGMDTILSLTVNTVLAASFIMLDKKKTVWWSALCAMLAYLAYLIRPDNFFYATAFPALYFLFRAAEEKKLFLVYATLFTVLFSIDSLAKFYFFGDILPLPFYVKANDYFVGYMGEKDWNPLSYFFNFLTYSITWVFLLVTLYDRKHISWYIVFLLPVWLTMMYFFNAVQIMGTAARYYLPSLPFIVFAGIVVLHNFFLTREQLPFITNRSFISRVILSVFFITILFVAKEPLSKSYSKLFLENEQAYEYNSQLCTSNTFPVLTDEYVNFFDFCKKLTPNTVIAAGENGKLSVEAQHLRIIDLNGLHEPYFAYNGFSADYLFRRKPTVIQLTHYNITKVNYDIVMHPDFFTLYDFYPNLFTFGVAVLKSDSATRAIFEQEINTLYGIDKPYKYTAHLKQETRLY